jgi:hypothetical protein
MAEDPKALCCGEETINSTHPISKHIHEIKKPSILPHPSSFEVKILFEKTPVPHHPFIHPIYKHV